METQHWDCQTCGACCETYRVSFYWAETDAHPMGQVPQAMTTSISPYHVAMLGTESKPVRCVALCGNVGQSVNCSIYEKRSSTCRAFEAGSDECAKARKGHGLPV